MYDVPLGNDWGKRITYWIVRICLMDICMKARFCFMWEYLLNIMLHTRITESKLRETFQFIFELLNVT